MAERNNTSERITRLEAGLASLIESTSRLGEAMSRAIEASDARSENLTSELFRKLDDLNRSANSRIEKVHSESIARFESHVRDQKPNWIGIIGSISVVGTLFGALIIFAVNSSIAPLNSDINSLAKDRERLNHSLEEMAGNRMSHSDDRQDETLRLLEKRIDEIRDVR
jgi:ElaB/YqjD/DUF883 family membrane-anchored ribosome-binding protein